MVLFLTKQGHERLFIVNRHATCKKSGLVKNIITSLVNIVLYPQTVFVIEIFGHIYFFLINETRNYNSIKTKKRVL